jgi:hypothetical protein
MQLATYDSYTILLNIATSVRKYMHNTTTASSAVCSRSMAATNIRSLQNIPVVSMPGHRVNHAFIFHQTKSNHCHLYDVDDELMMIRGARNGANTSSELKMK